jgi:D-lactate dehydrogenase (cytochrome)
MSWVEELASLVTIERSATARELHSRDVSGHAGVWPDAVALPENAQQVANVLAWANQRHIPVTPWGAGTSVEGNPIPIRQGISLSLERMNRIKEISLPDRLAVVEAGTKYRTLNQQLARSGWQFAVEIGGDATLGGMIANNAAGPKAVKYGSTRAHILGLEVALTDGRLLRTGGRSAKQSCGYNLTQLFAGSEGTLGVITEAIVRLTAEPAVREVVLARFGSVREALGCVAAMRGLDAGAIEFLDHAYMGFLGEIAADTLFCEFHTAGHGAVAETICRAGGAVSVERAGAELWAARLRAYTASQEANPGARLLTTDTAVPVGAFAEMVAFLQSELAGRRLTGYLLGHAGDGNLHVILPWRSAEEWEAVAAFQRAAVQKSLELGGTASGEHGVGLGKRQFLEAEHGAEAVGVMRGIKALFDPRGILNPGKVLPEGGGPGGSEE